MADIPGYLLVHTVSVETWEGTGAYGDTYAAPVDVPCFVDDARKIVRNPDGDEVVSESTVIGFLSDAPKFVEKTKVILPGGRPSIVILKKDRDDGGLGAPQHVEVFCQ
ncbi:hypothetical protein [Aeromicrobium sp. 9AM]|uniref:hypothetical protein n=1 Tax=Aeromicrobium sp. 9AM TaxID=2653126 RepID=UPI0012F2B53E|nr:hypothetical protein [Aeromicrobium sp. 9AM]VXB82020.1 conserved hypothetical protein [Aeromicrobium sp. 9AM]